MPIEQNIVDEVLQSGLNFSPTLLNQITLHKKENKEDKFITRSLEIIFNQSLYFNTFSNFSTFCEYVVDNKITTQKEIDEFHKRMYVQHRCYFIPNFTDFQSAFDFFNNFIEKYTETSIDRDVTHDISKMFSHSSKYFHSSSSLISLMYTKKYEHALSSMIGHNRFIPLTYSPGDKSIKSSIDFFKLLQFRFRVLNLNDVNPLDVRKYEIHSFFEEIRNNNDDVLKIFSSFSYSYDENTNFQPNGFVPEILFPINSFKEDVAIALVPSINMVNYIQYLLLAKRYHDCQFSSGNYQIVGSNAQNISDQALFFGGNLKTIETNLGWYKKDIYEKSGKKLSIFNEKINIDFLKNQEIPKKHRKKYLINFGEKIFNKSISNWLNSDIKKYKNDSLIYKFLQKSLEKKDVEELTFYILNEYQKNTEILDVNIKKFLIEGIQNEMYNYLIQGDVK